MCDKKGWGAHRHLAVGTQCPIPARCPPGLEGGEKQDVSLGCGSSGTHTGLWAPAAYVEQAARHRDPRDTRVGWCKRGGGDTKCQEQGLGPPNPPTEEQGVLGKVGGSYFMVKSAELAWDRGSWR